ncbi:RHS repeat-associated core domain-containing protein [Spirochaeta cellobiosiphila]|uniref:RHS repeat-associated core domain-containing protein n=1 Tax=Spirochaeta cellobiosiphila TaxID=504483 RepID=UPI000412FF9B|nr:RHS repeat-associated core domain-containing protein [Spirochaeta cellobiosiphila]
MFDQEGKVLEEHSDSTVVRYVFLKSRRLARIENDQTLYYGVDSTNSTILMTDEKGEVVWSADATPFGDYANMDSDLDIRFKYTGKDIDEDTGLYYSNARWYDAELGRFI